MGKKQTEWSKEFNQKAYDQLSITVPKGRRETVKALAASRGTTVNSLVNTFLRELAGVTEEQWNPRYKGPEEKGSAAPAPPMPD